MLICILHYYIFTVVNLHKCLIQNNILKTKYVLLINYVIYVNSFVIYKPNVTFL